MRCLIEDVFDAEGIKSKTLAVQAWLLLFEVLEQESPVTVRSHPLTFCVRGERSVNQEGAGAHTEFKKVP